MKSTVFTEILDKTTIEVKTDCQTTIKRLMTMQGFCRDTGLKGSPMMFSCYKNGKIFVDNNSRTRRRGEDRIYSVVGQVREENGKTMVDIYAARKRFTVGSRIAFSVMFLIGAAADVYTMFLDGNYLTQKGALVLALVLGAIVPLVVDTRNEKKNKDKDIQAMKNAVIDRLVAVDRWDD